MTSEYYPPQYKDTDFHCPYCHVYASQGWFEVFIQKGGFEPTKFYISECVHCRQKALWSKKGKLVLPEESSVVMPSPDLPEDCKIDYMEARSVYPYSPRASAALLRLCIQKLMPHLGEKGDNLNDDINALVTKGLSPLTQQALDVCRVVGNNAVHPGEINIEDTPEIAQSLFGLVNFITEDRITRPRQIQGLYNQLPEGAKIAIEKRDGQT
jgi:hypothetical protein